MKNELLKSVSICKTSISICFLAALLCALVFDAQTSWANDERTPENNNIAEYALSATSESVANDQEAIGSGIETADISTDVATENISSNGAAPQADGSSNSSVSNAPSAQEANGSTNPTTPAEHEAEITQPAGGIATVQPADTPANSPATNDATKLQTKDSSEAPQLKSNPPAPLPDGDYIKMISNEIQMSQNKVLAIGKSTILISQNYY